jgi:thiol-disulfide isomerase/thioredoxin
VHVRLVPILALLLTGCATTSPAPMGVISDLSLVEGVPVLCEHQVPEKVCTRHHPDLVPKFKAVNDWCPEHERPESQCLICHPTLTFEALPKLPPAADVVWLAHGGEDVPSLAEHAVLGKVTVFDFYADWCAPCREVDRHMFGLIAKGHDLALRKLNVLSWETPLAKRHLATTPNLPLLVVFGKDGKLVSTIYGFDLPGLDAAIALGAKR